MSGSGREPGWALPPVPADEEQRIRHLASLRIVDSLPERAFDDLATLAAHVCGAPVAFISLIERERQWFKASVGSETTETTRDVSFCAHAINEPDQVLVVPDATKDERFALNPDVVGGLGIRLYAGAPLVMPDGVALGTLCVVDQKPRTLSAEQLQMLVLLSRQVVLQMQLRASVMELEAAQRALRGATVARPLMRVLVEHIMRAGNVDASALTRVGEEAAAAAAMDDLDGLLETYGQLGLGKLTVLKAGPERWEFRGEELFERRSGARVTTCYLALGFLQAAVARAMRRPALGTETSCCSRRDAECRFVIALR